MPGESCSVWRYCLPGPQKDAKRLAWMRSPLSTQQQSVGLGFGVARDRELLLSPDRCTASHLCACSCCHNPAQLVNRIALGSEQSAPCRLTALCAHRCLSALADVERLTWSASAPPPGSTRPSQEMEALQKEALSHIQVGCLHLVASRADIKHLAQLHMAARGPRRRWRPCRRRLFLTFS